MTVRIEARTPVGTPPSWAVLMRQLFDAIEDAAPQVFERYTHPDGRLLWPPSPTFRASTRWTTATRAFTTGRSFTCWAAARGF